MIAVALLPVAVAVALTAGWCLLAGWLIHRPRHARPRPVLRITLPPRWARILVAAGARAAPGSGGMPGGRRRRALEQARDGATVTWLRSLHADTVSPVMRARIRVAAVVTVAALAREYARREPGPLPRPAGDWTPGYFPASDVPPLGPDAGPLPPLPGVPFWCLWCEDDRYRCACGSYPGDQPPGPEPLEDYLTALTVSTQWAQDTGSFQAVTG